MLHPWTNLVIACAIIAVCWVISDWLERKFFQTYFTKR